MEIKKPISSAVIYIAAWILCSFIVIANVLFVREAVRDVMTAVTIYRIENAAVGEANAEAINAAFVKQTVDYIVMIVGGLAAVSLSLYFEYYFRMGRQQGVLMKRIGKVFAFLVGVLVVALIVRGAV